jgi:protein-tyrosine phosphatase
MRIVFVCTGNTCRSPMAEALCKKRLADRLACTLPELPQRGYDVLSAGLAAYTGGGAAQEAIEAVATYGGELSSHRSQPLTEELLNADLLIGMTQVHVEVLRELLPDATGRVRLLNAGGIDLADPVGCDKPVYVDCAARIWADLDVLLADVHATASPSTGNP